MCSFVLSGVAMSTIQGISYSQDMAARILQGSLSMDDYFHASIAASFKNYLIEEEKTVFFTFGRMNPPTTGHEKLMNELSKKSGKNPYRVYLSHSTDKKKNPLDFKYKVKTVRKFFPKHARSVMLNKKVKNV